ncbi:MAG: hypothetical protein JO149_07040 [Gammaproteobacteria bacterium]|nr:hypothetical protein [Gammaproteobacteria bacterium]
MPWTSHDLRNRFQSLVNALVELHDVFLKKNSEEIKAKYKPFFNDIRLACETSFDLLYKNENMPDGAEVKITAFVTAINMQLKNIGQHKTGGQKNTDFNKKQLEVINQLNSVRNAGENEIRQNVALGRTKEQIEGKTQAMTTLDEPNVLLAKIESLGEPGFYLELMTEQDLMKSNDELEEKATLIKKSNNTYTLYGRKKIRAEEEWEYTYTELGEFPTPKTWANKKRVYISANDELYTTLRKGHTPLALASNVVTHLETKISIESSSVTEEISELPAIQSPLPIRASAAWSTFFKRTIIENPKKAMLGLMGCTLSVGYCSLEILNRYLGESMDHLIHADETGITHTMVLAGAFLITGGACCAVALGKTACQEPERHHYMRIS